MKTVIRLLPLILAMMLILGLTIQKPGGTTSLSEKCRHYAVRLADSLGMETEGVWWNDGIHFRKLGHIPEYFILGLGAYFAIRSVYISVIVCFIVSIGDQFIKTRIPTRHFDVTDLPFDIFGYALGILVMWLVIKHFNNLESEFIDGEND